jgi:hypothetical protein
MLTLFLQVKCWDLWDGSFDMNENNVEATGI